MEGGNRDLSPFVGASRMAEEMRAFDWGSSPLGPPVTWPEALKTACRICLTSRFPILLWWGPELRMLYNDGYAPMLGDKPAALAAPGERVWADVWPIVGPMLLSVMAGEGATWSDDQLLPMQRSGYWEETYFTYSYSPIYGPDGSVAGVFTAVTETTAKVLASRRLQVLSALGEISGTRFSDVRSTMDAILWVLAEHRADVPHAVAYQVVPDGPRAELVASFGVRAGSAAYPWSVSGDTPDQPAWAVAASGESLLRTGIRDRHGDSLAPHPMGVGGLSDVQADAELALPITVAGQDGVRVVLIVGISPMRTLDDAYRQFFDLVGRHTSTALGDAVATEAERARARALAELDQVRSAFFANVSHELRTPLTLIAVPTEQALVDRDEPLPPTQRHRLEVISRNTGRLRRLVDDMLDFARLEGGRLDPRFVLVDLSALTTELAETFAPVVAKAGLALAVDIEPLPTPARVDPRMWEKIVLNLLSNAVKFTDRGAVRISLRDRGGRIRLEVADDGIGIAAEHLPRLFERFYRVPQTAGRSYEGAGIGLALVRELVACHDGHVDVRSVTGSGSTFVIDLPYGPAEFTPAEPDGGAPDWAALQRSEILTWIDRGPAAAAQDELSPASDRLVLIVDDNRDMRELLATTLRPHWRVATANDGLEAWGIIGQEPPDLVLTDVMMPRADGLWLVRRLRENPATESIPLVLLSARAGLESAVDGLDAGADDYLVKPFTTEELLARVRSRLELSEIRGREASFRRAVVDSMQDGFGIADAEGTFVEVNAAFEGVTGYGAAGLPYRYPYPWTVDPDEDAPGRTTTDAAFAAYRTSRGGEFIVPIRHRDGRRLWVAASVAPVSGPNAASTMSVATLRDVTAERSAAARQDTLARFATRLSSLSTVDEVLAAGVAAIGEAFGAATLAVRWPVAGPPVAAGYHRSASFVDIQPWLEQVRWPTFRIVARDDDIAFPVGLHGDTVVCLRLGSRRHLEADQHVVLELLAGQFAQALGRAASFDETRAIALALQHAILGPTDLPPGFAVRYQPAVEPLEIGGDWHDVVRLPSGAIGVVVGDCVGRGLAAASVMGQLRSASRALLLRDEGPARALTELDAFASTVDGAFCATVCCAVIDPDTGRVTYSSAGHPPPVVASAAGTRLLTEGRGLPLAVGDQPRTEASTTLPDGAALMLYTDGLVERRNIPISVAIVHAAQVLLRAGHAGPDAAADEVMAALRPPDGFDDDVALLVYCRPAPDLRVELAADPGSLAGMRADLRAWLDRVEVTEAERQGVLVAVSEACANAIEHGARSRPASRIRIHARVAAAAVMEIRVSDDGDWKPPTVDANRGRGIPLMEAMMDRVTIETGPAGTTVHLTRALAGSDPRGSAGEGS